VAFALGKKIEKASGSRAASTGIPFSMGMVLVTLGVVYGDIGTSPMYTMKAIMSGNGGLPTMDSDVILGALSLIIWTLTLITTVKYVLVAMKADNHNEGGIFALFALVKRFGKWLILPAMIGGAALLADGILTPAVTVTTAIEGLRTIDFGMRFIGEDQAKVVVITLGILAILFLVQRAGTSSIGRAFGPLMTIWFIFLGVTGLINMGGDLNILRALNPVRGIMFLFGPINKAGMMVLGNVFLCTTGAEALYSDMGHVGKKNIFASWPFVKVCLILNYLGQGAWILANQGNAHLAAIPDLNPFFEMLPEDLRPLRRHPLHRRGHHRLARPSSPGPTRSSPRRRASTSCPTCRSPTPPRPRASSTSRWSTPSCGSAAPASSSCSGARATWRRPTGWRSPSRCS
jgi:KUP system potassium uptake protein